MQFSTLTLLATLTIAGSASAAATGNAYVKRDGCSLETCVVDLGGTVASCVSAAADLFLNPFSDGKCVADITNLAANVIPDSCEPCI